VTFAPKIYISFKKTQENQRNPTLRWVFLGGFFGFFWAGFLLPTLVSAKLYYAQIPVNNNKS
jgi:hypothetical protein